METIGYGFLLGVGIMLAVLAFLLAAGVIALVVLLIGYLRNRTPKEKPNRPREPEQPPDWRITR